MDIRYEARQVILRTQDGVPYLAPEIVLLFKAKKNRDKDDRDFEQVGDQLPPERKAWLRDALSQYDPRHKWLSRL